MTFQVGLFGSDGMLLAGDTRGSSNGYTSDQTKFVFDSGMSLVVAQYGTQVAMRVARKLVDEKWDGDWAKGEKTASDIWKEENKGDVPLWDQHTQSLIAVLPEQRRMAQFLLRSATIVTFPADKVVSGVEYPYASLLLGRYYSPSLPISKLKKLAALTVWLTGQFAPQFVGGLEIIEFLDGETPRIVEPQEISELLAWAENADSKIRQLLIAD